MYRLRHDLRSRLALFGSRLHGTRLYDDFLFLGRDDPDMLKSR